MIQLTDSIGLIKELVFLSLKGACHKIIDPWIQSRTLRFKTKMFDRKRTSTNIKQTVGQWQANMWV